MKKKVFVFAFLVSMVFSVGAQDTISLGDVRVLDKCYIPSVWPHYPDDFTYYRELDKHVGQVQFLGQNHQQELLSGFRVLTEDTLEVYGLASIMCPGSVLLEVNGGPYPGMDTSSRYAYTWLMIFAGESDTLRPLVDTSYTYVHAWQMPEHYVNITWDVIMQDSLVVPLYERYFPAPVSVTDSFYLGYYVQRDHPINDNADLFFLRVMSDLEAPYNHDTARLFQRTHWNYINPMTGKEVDQWSASWSFDIPRTHPLFFPIITPPDSNVIVPVHNDTTVAGIHEPDIVSRYTTVSPNPATEKVQVASSFGLLNIEAYNEKGQCIYRSSGGGYKTAIDVSSWSRGAYVLRITTAVGVTNKKLILK
ncbi:MAG: T9SS type A sorting domain-containing protein [Bacteroidales bacterium]|nr:T9SS type A sorting domain-containing protein [Bacteroidales bacterium]